MYTLEDIKTVHLEVTSRCQASCPMCVRNVQGGIDSPNLRLTEITLDNFKKWFPVNFIQQLDRLYMCGNTGDPIVAKDTLEIFDYLRETNPGINLSMNTNGSARNQQFWKELARIDVQVRFGIDGLEDTHSLYRIGTDFDKIIDNAYNFIQAGGNATWDMLIFDHNKHQVSVCEELSKHLGFKNFVAKNTSRFQTDNLSVLNKDGTISHVLKPSIKSKQITEKLENQQPVINCKVKEPGSLYISAEGNVAPCCWLDFNAMPASAPSYADFVNNGFKNPSLHIQDLTEIFKSNFFTRIEHTWTTKSLRACSRQCGTIDKFNEQFN
jgi:MoaA/NifB/PqqE/SkfB family radical SAM enzyme